MFSSIRSKFIVILLLFGGLPMLIVGYLSYESASRALLSQTKEQLGNVVEKTAQQLDIFFHTAQKDIAFLSDSPFLQLSFLQHEFGQRLTDVERLLSEYLKTHQYIQRIYLVDLSGVSILAVDETAMDNRQMNFGLLDWFSTALTHGAALFDPSMQAVDAAPEIILARRVHDFKAHHQPVGVLVFVVKSDAFIDYVRSLTIGENGYALLLNHAGHLIYHPEKTRILKDGLMKNSDARLSAHVARMQQGQAGFGDYRFMGLEKFLVYAPCRELDWSVAISLNASELLSDILRLRQRVMTLVVIVLALINPVAYFFIRGVTQPISRLIEGAAALGQGDLEHEIRVDTSEELGALANEFNSMAQRIKSGRDELIALKTFNENILRSVSSGILTVDGQNRPTSFNASAASILNLEPRGNGGCAPLDNDEGFSKVLGLLKTTLKGRKKRLHHQVMLDAGDGGTKYLEVHTTLLRDSENRTLGAIADIRDITHRKRMETRMVRIDKLASLGELSAGMAHEIRNPLAGIKTSVQVLANRNQGDREMILISGILDEINRLDKIVTKLLRFSRPSPPVFKPEDLLPILEKALDLTIEKLRTNGIAPTYGWVGRSCPVMVDREQIQQVFLNLLLNAIKSMPQGGQLEIAMQRMDDIDGMGVGVLAMGMDDVHAYESYVRVRFRDTGCGIDENKLAKVFDPFFTTDPAGTGLGLSIAHKLIEENNGVIYIESIPGRGTDVIVLLPTVES